MKPYIDYNETLDPDANSYQEKLARKSKVLISEERQGHLNRMKKSYKTGYQEKELTVPIIKLPCPQSFINGPDTLNVGEPGIFHTRAVESFNSFDIQSVWEISTPANMGYDQRIIDSIPPYTGKESTPKRYAKPSGERRWSKDDGLTKRWSSGGGNKKWNTDSGKKRWEGQQELAEDTETEEGFCRAEYRFNHSGMVRIDSTPVLPGVSPLLKSSPKYVTVKSGWTPSPPPVKIYWIDDFNDNSFDITKWHTPVEKCFAITEVDERLRFQPDVSYCQSSQFEDSVQSKCPKLYFERDYWQVQIYFKDFIGDSKGLYLLYKHGNGATDYKSIEYIHDPVAGTVQNRWGNEGSWSYSTTKPRPATGTMKIRRNGVSLEFWNQVDSQWESIAYIATNQSFPIHIGVLTELPSLSYSSFSCDANFICGQAYNYASARSTSTDCLVASGGPVGQQAIGIAPSISYRVYRTYLRFGTSSIPDNADITRAYLQMELQTKDCSPYNPAFDVEIIKGDWQYPLCNYTEANYDLGLSAATDVNWLTNICTQAIASYDSPDMDTSYIDKTGHTKYILTSSRDRSGSSPTPQTVYPYKSYEKCNVHYLPTPKPRLKVEYYHKDGQASFDYFHIEAL